MLEYLLYSLTFVILGIAYTPKNYHLLIKTGCNNVVLLTLFIVVNNIV